MPVPATWPNALPCQNVYGWSHGPRTAAAKAVSAGRMPGTADKVRYLPIAAGLQPPHAWRKGNSLDGTRDHAPRGPHQRVSTRSDALAPLATGSPHFSAIPARKGA
jgi:hypothetical protein